MFRISRFVSFFFSNPSVILTIQLHTLFCCLSGSMNFSLISVQQHKKALQKSFPCVVDTDREVRSLVAYPHAQGRIDCPTPVSQESALIARLITSFLHLVLQDICSMRYILSVI